jgi:hypothetical protein
LAYLDPGNSNFLYLCFIFIFFHVTRKIKLMLNFRLN